MVQDIGINELKKLTQVIKENYEYDFSNYATSSFKRRIMRILELKKLTNVESLIDKIRKRELTNQEFLHEITVNVTEMFRDPSFWRVLKHMLPGLVNATPKFKIWHAGCSSGEEVYSMVILLKELSLLDKTEIFATDIDSNILSKARSGRIQTKNMILNNENYAKVTGKGDLATYFKTDNDFSELDASLLSKVNFQTIDLVKSSTFIKADMILCRNVLIYFNQTLQNEVLKKMHSEISSGGLLALGAKETITWSEITGKFIPFNVEEKIYKKVKE